MWERERHVAWFVVWAAGMLCVIGVAVFEFVGPQTDMATECGVLGRATFGVVDGWPAVGERCAMIVRGYWLVGFAAVAAVVSVRFGGPDPRRVAVATTGGILGLGLLDTAIEEFRGAALEWVVAVLAVVGLVLLGIKRWGSKDLPRLAPVGRMCLAVVVVAVLLWLVDGPRVPLLLAAGLVAVSWWARDVRPAVAGVGFLLASWWWGAGAFSVGFGTQEVARSAGSPGILTRVTVWDMGDVLIPGLVLLTCALWMYQADHIRDASSRRRALVAAGVVMFGAESVGVVAYHVALQPTTAGERDGFPRWTVTGDWANLFPGGSVQPWCVVLLGLAVAAGVLRFAWKHRDGMVGAVGAVFLSVLWWVAPGVSAGASARIVAGGRFDDSSAFWRELPSATAPSLVLLGGAAVLAVLEHRRVRQVRA